MQRCSGFAQQGASLVWTSGISSSNLVQDSWPFACITVFLTGTTTLAQLFSDDVVPPTPMSNPFHANEFGWWWFYAPNGRYDVRIQPTAAQNWACAWTIGDVLLYDTAEDFNANLIAGDGIVFTQNPGVPNQTIISTSPDWWGDQNAEGHN